MLSLRDLVRIGQPLRRWPIAKGGVLLLFWLLLTGRADWHHLVLGVMAVWFSLYVSSKLIPKSSPQSTTEPPVKVTVGTLLWLPLQLLAFFIRMLWDLVQANVRVAAIVLRVRMPLAPILYDYHPPVRAEWARVLLANSVTLTPGTLTVELGPDRFLVHALTPQAAHSLPGWAAEQRVARIESRLRGDG